MADISCPTPRIPDRSELLAQVNKVKREMPGVKIGALRREAARRMGLDYKTFMDVWDKRIPNLSAVTKIPKATKIIKTSAGPKTIQLPGSGALSDAEAARKALEKARFLRGNLNKSKGWTSASNDALTRYTEGNVVQMQLLKRDPEKFFASMKPLSANPSVAEKMNFAIRQQMIDDVKALEGLIQKNVLDRDVTVLRGVSHDMSHVKIGDVIADPGFLSTTTDSKTAFDFATGRGGRVTSGGKAYQGWTFSMKAPKGTNAVAGADYQHEIVFGPGLAQRVVDVDYIGHVIYTEVI